MNLRPCDQPYLTIGLIESANRLSLIDGWNGLRDAKSSLWPAGIVTILVVPFSRYTEY
jgi:hypothetical protein